MKKLILLLVVILSTSVNAAPVLFKSQSSGYICKGDNGQQLYGWQLCDTSFDKVPDTWYYFDPNNGKLVINEWTEDGYYVDENGKWLESLGCARDYTTEGFKFTTSSSKFMYKFKDGTSPIGTWCLLSPFKDHIYYWFYFDYSGVLSTNQVNVQGKYKTDSWGRLLNEEGKPVSKFIYDDDISKYVVDSSFQDANGVSQGGIIYNQNGTIINNSANESNIIYSSIPTQATKFLSAIKKDSAKNCEFELEDRNFYDMYAEDYRGIMRKAIEMNGTSSSFQLNTKTYNYFNITYALEYNNGSAPGSDEDGYARLQIFVNGSLYDEDEDIYTNSSVQVRNVEIEVNKGDNVIVSFTSDTSTRKLIMTAKVKKKKNDDESEDIDITDNEDTRTTGGITNQDGPGAHIDYIGDEYNEYQ